MCPDANLKLKIKEEVEKNPALEILEERGTISLDTAQEPPEVYEYFENSSDPGFSYARGSDDEDAKRRFLEGAVARGESLHEHLLWQLRLHPGLTAEEIRLGSFSCKTWTMPVFTTRTLQISLRRNVCGPHYLL